MNCTGSGADPLAGEAVKFATGVVTVLPSDSSENQYVFVESLLARMTEPLAALTDCLLPVALFRLGEAASLMTGVPRPAAKESALIGDVFSNMVPGEPVNAHPESGAVA